MIRSQLPMPKYRSMPLTVKRAIILWISIFQFADALPTIRRQDLSSRSIASGEAVGVTYRPECTKAVLASIGWETKSSSESGKQWLTVYGGAEAYAKEWCKQIQQNWIDESYSCQGHGKPRQDPFLSDDLTPEIVDRKRLPMSGQFKTGNTGDLGYFTLPGAQGPNHEYRILKLLDLGTTPGCEKCSLGAFRDSVQAGYASLNGHKVGVLIMKVQHEVATPLTQLAWWKGLQKVKAKALTLELLKEKVFEQVFELSEEGDSLNGNFGPNDIVTDEDVRYIAFLNYSYPGILKLKFKPKKETLLFWFLERWYFLWKHVYHDAGVEIPSQASISVEVGKMLKTQGNIPVEGAGGKISKVNK
ncbi:hypothetical protein C8R42DRAFT_411870 [Lentinula raphanica]|nr:hypothetical protein C8R42DRAFT_411870 [Lentinula raphanica]